MGSITMCPLKVAFIIALVIPAALLPLVSSSRVSLSARNYLQHNVPGVFSFGDSLADVGTNIWVKNCTARVDYPPYGETYFRHPTGRYCDGRIVFDFLSQRLGLPLPQAYLKPHSTYEHGANFASGDSGFLASTSAARNVVSLPRQIQQFQELSASLPDLLGDDQSQKLLSEAIYTLVSGNNDIGGNYLTNSTFRNTTTPAEFILLLLEEVQEALLTLYAAGGRKFVVFELGPLGCTPYLRLAGYSTEGGACYEVVNELVLAYNAGLKQIADSLPATLTGATIVYGKLYDFMMEVIENGEDYGYVNTTYACCGAGLFHANVSCGREVPEDEDYEPFLCSDPSEYLFWDGEHATERTYFLLFNRYWSGDTSAAEPMNIQDLAQLHFGSGSSQQA